MKKVDPTICFVNPRLTRFDYWDKTTAVIFQLFGQHLLMMLVDFALGTKARKITI